ncbi:succinyl-CoA--L-malate CoA-transferase beta subunit (plasmid) [Antarctobacter heliothermus]|uniref:Succinyl-CoA--L-malate CoA-transferase beta subunit n=1 Tax=Antarctobacter heliothermus TaxID=74033 RepID=A0A222EBF1_9RHOB|nr:CoA transferase [Antarctobacter heliothermus]ASP23515.1 succinyl-CoA--L-malate CoA-transferase beta subunit [Antarctobacter heliothermus]
MERSIDPAEPILAGLRVLDFGRYIAAPLCAALLADLGADVIRVEPVSGASDRDVMPLGPDRDGALYAQMNRGKRSLAIDFRDPNESSVLRALVMVSDVVIVNMPPAQLTKAGLSYDELRALKPDIILTTISAYSTIGASRNLTGFDGTGQALSGAMHITGDGAMPTRAAVSYVDYSTGIAAAYATLAAIIRHMRTGKGQQVETSLLQNALAIMNPILIEAATGTRERAATGNRSPISGPSDAFRSADGWVMIQVIGDMMFARFAERIGRPDLVGRPEYASDIARGENGAALSEIVAEWCRIRSSAEILASLTEMRIPCVPILSAAEALQSAELQNGGYFSYPAARDVPVVAPLAQLAGTTGPRPAPQLGEHNDEIMRELGELPT